MTRLSDSFCTADFRGDCAFDRFLAAGGAATEEEVTDFVRPFLDKPEGLDLRVNGMGCSTLQARGRDGRIFGRNFDWDDCPLLVLTAHPSTGYDSISTVNLDFITKRYGTLSDRDLLIASHYAPLEGMNQRGLCLSVNLLPNGMALCQDTGKPKLTITTAIRLLLDRAANVDEALDLLNSYDIGTSTGLTVHYLLSDAAGRSVCVEFIHNVLSAVDTPVMTNHYMTPGPYFGQARNNSLDRFRQLTEFLAQHPVTDIEGVLEAMRSVHHGTQWTAVYDQSALTADLYHKSRPDTPLHLSI